MSRTRIKICGLYREQHVDYVNAARPDYAGFVFYPPSHRYVDREMMKRLREKLSHKIPAVGVFVNVPMEEVASYIGYGTGSCFDWQLLKEQVPARPYLLAGGLRAENIEEALERFVPWGVDVSSGVETEKEKDFGKIRDIIEIIRSR